MPDHPVPPARSAAQPMLTWREAGRLNRRIIVLMGIFAGFLGSGMYATTGMPKPLSEIGVCFVLVMAGAVLLAWAIFYTNSFSSNRAQR